MNVKQTLGIGIKIIKAKVFKRKIPLKVTYHITYRCNLSCPFCNRRTMDAPAEMNTIQVKEMMREFRGMGACFWVFNGGEPLLREDLPELIDYAKDLGLHCSIVTNGVLLAEKLEKVPRFRKLDFVQVSLQGPKEIHEKMCGYGTYDRIIEGLNLLKRLRIRTNILTLISGYNIEYFDGLIKLVAQYRMTIAFQPIIIQQSYNLEQYFPERERYAEAVNSLIRRKRAGAHISSSFEYLKMLRDYQADIPNGMPCYASRLYCNVTPGGYLVPCCAKLAQAKPENLGLKIGFKKAFEQLDDMHKCQDCYYFGPQELNIRLR